MLAVLSAPTAESTAVLWQPTPVAAQPAEEAAVCLAVSTVAWIARPPVWQDAQAVVGVLGRPVAGDRGGRRCVVVAVQAHVGGVGGLGRGRERVLGVQAARLTTWQASHAVAAKVADAWAVLVGACLAASAAWAGVVPV